MFILHLLEGRSPMKICAHADNSAPFCQLILQRLHGGRQCSMALLQGLLAQQAGTALRCRPFAGTPVQSTSSSSHAAHSVGSSSRCQLFVCAGLTQLPATHVESSQRALDALKLTSNINSEHLDYCNRQVLHILLLTSRPHGLRQQEQLITEANVPLALMKE